MPCGNPTYFEVSSNQPVYFEPGKPGYIEMFTKQLKDNFIYEINPLDPSKRPYGFFEVEVETPEFLQYPILQTRYKTHDGVRTVSPLGKWTGVYSTTEIYNAMDNFGYKFKVLRGFLFPRQVIFQDFVKHFYNIKSNTSKDDPRYYIAKLIMNSLYGKMGQGYELETHAIVSENELMDLIQDKNIEVSSIVELGDTDINPSNLIINNFKSNLSIPKGPKVLTPDNLFDSDESDLQNLNFISFLDKQKYHNDNLDLLTSFKGSNPIASEVAGDSRVDMSIDIKFLIENDYIIYYMDTDSLVVNKPLPDWMVSPTELGKLKLEYFIEEGVFLAPKVYAIILPDGKVIIKVKGLSRDTIERELTFELMKSLLTRDKSLILNQIKSKRNFSESTINLIEQTYNLIPTQNKRELIYQNNLLVGTRPYTIGPDKTIR